MSAQGSCWRGATTIIITGLLWHTPVVLADADNAELADLVKQQAEQIKRLKRRVDKLERQPHARSRSDHQVATKKAERVKSVSKVDKSRQIGSVTSRQDRASQAGRALARAGVKTLPTDKADKAGSTPQPSLKKRVDRLAQNHVKVNWSGGAPKFTNPDGPQSLSLGGRIQYDFSSTFGSRYNGQDSGPYAGSASRNITGTQFKQVRLHVKGNLLDPVLYKLEVDFGGGKTRLRDAYLAFQHHFSLGKGTLYLGDKFADRGLLGRTPGLWTWFVDRSVVVNAISPQSGGYNLGATGEFVGNNGWHASLTVGKGTLGGPSHHSDNLTLLSRAHWNPVDNDLLTLHLGATSFYERFHGKQDKLKKNAQISTGYNDNLEITEDALYDPKSSYGYKLTGGAFSGPFAAIFSWGRRELQSHTEPDSHYIAYSGQLGYSLTGEPFGYSSKLGTFSATNVDHPVFKGGWGAWQLVGRYQALDFAHNRHYHGGSGHGLTIGLNWYLNKWLRAMFDYTRWHTNNNELNRNTQYGLSDNGNSIDARAQISF